SSGTSTVRGASSTSRRTSTSSPAPRPVALRVSALNEIRNWPPIEAIELRYWYPPSIVTTTGTRLPRSKAVTTSSGTTMPTLLPPEAHSVVRKVCDVSAMPIGHHDAGELIAEDRVLAGPGRHRSRCRAAGTSGQSPATRHRDRG